MHRSIILKILRPCDEAITWEDLGYLLRGLSYKICKMSNYCLTHHLLRALKLETENLNPRGHLYCYPRLAEEYPEVPSSIICAAEGRARKVFQQNAEGILRSEKSLPGFRKDCSIPIPVAGYRLQKEGEATCTAEIQFLSRQGAKMQKMPGRIKLMLASNWRDKTAGKIFSQLAEGTVKRGVATIFRKKRAWYISIPYETEVLHSAEDFEPDLTMGVAFGVHCALCYAFNRSLKRGELKGDEVIAHWDKFMARRNQIQEQYKWSGRKGHGRESALKPLRQLYEKERNFRRLTNERYAKWIVEIAEKNRCGKICIEAGDIIQQGRRKILLASWPRDELRRKILEKAEAKGIAVQECPDEVIRIRCSQCGALQESAEGKRSFTCSACGYGKEENKTGIGFVSVDYNAARNLAVYKSEKKEL